MKEGLDLKLKIRGTGKTVEEAADIVNLARGTLYNYFKLDVIDQEVKDLFLSKMGIKIEHFVQVEQQDYTTKRRDKKNTESKTLDYYQAGANASLKTSGEIIPVSKSSGTLNISELFKGSQFAIRVSGNSMTPNYPSGCIIGIRIIEDFMINPGSVYVIETGNDLWIKRLYYKSDDRDSEILELVSDNKMKEESGQRKGKYCYPAFHLHKNDIKNIFRVTGVFKSNMLTIIEN